MQDFEGLPAYAWAWLGRNKSCPVILIVSVANTIVFGKLKEVAGIGLVYACLGMNELKSSLVQT